MAEHTPTPWKTESGAVFAELDYFDLHVADIVSFTGQTDEQVQANAEFIVLACNAHDDLLSAAKRFSAFTDLAEQGWAWGNDDDAIIYELSGHGGNERITLGDFRALRAAISRVEG